MKGPLCSPAGGGGAGGVCVTVILGKLIPHPPKRGHCPGLRAMRWGRRVVPGTHGLALRAGAGSLPGGGRDAELVRVMARASPAPSSRLSESP